MGFVNQNVPQTTLSKHFQKKIKANLKWFLLWSIQPATLSGILMVLIVFTSAYDAIMSAGMELLTSGVNDFTLPVPR